MPKFLAVFLVAVATTLVATTSTPASAHRYRHGHARHRHHDDIVLRLGYHRHGPPTGYRFGFATYRGDPFARDDYYDGHSCYYLHHRDFCLAFRKPLGLPH